MLRCVCWKSGEMGVDGRCLMRRMRNEDKAARMVVANVEKKYQERWKIESQGLGCGSVSSPLLSNSGLPQRLVPTRNLEAMQWEAPPASACQVYSASVVEDRRLLFCNDSQEAGSNQE